MVKQARSGSEHHENRLEFETLISDLSSRFINLPPGEVDRAIEDALRRVCEALAIDSAVLWQWSVASPDVIAPTHIYAALEGSRNFDPLRQERFPWVVQQMLAGRGLPFPRLRTCRRRPPSTGKAPASAAFGRT